MSFMGAVDPITRMPKDDTIRALLLESLTDTVGGRVRPYASSLSIMAINRNGVARPPLKHLVNILHHPQISLATGHVDPCLAPAIIMKAIGRRRTRTQFLTEDGGSGMARRNREGRCRARDRSLSLYPAGRSPGLSVRRRSAHAAIVRASQGRDSRSPGGPRRALRRGDRRLRRDVQPSC